MIHPSPTNRPLRKSLCSALARCVAGVGIVAAAGVAGCKHTIAVEPIEVKPIHLTLDVNLKVDRELDEFFDYEEDEASSSQPTTMPAVESEDPVTTPTAGQQQPGAATTPIVEGGAR